MNYPFDEHSYTDEWNIPESTWKTIDALQCEETELLRSNIKELQTENKELRERVDENTELRNKLQTAIEVHKKDVERVNQLQYENKKLKECLVDIESKEITMPEIDAVYMKSLAQCCLIELEEGE